MVNDVKVFAVFDDQTRTLFGTCTMNWYRKWGERIIGQYYWDIALDSVLYRYGWQYTFIEDIYLMTRSGYQIIVNIFRCLKASTTTSICHLLWSDSHSLPRILKFWPGNRRHWSGRALRQNALSILQTKTKQILHACKRAGTCWR